MLPAEHIIKYPAAFLTGLLVTYLLTPQVRRVAAAIGMVDQPEGRRIHRRPIPRGGGIALFIGFHAACAVVFLMPWTAFESQLHVQWWLRFLAASSLIFGVGLADDRLNIPPLLKLAGQCAAALLAYWLGIRVSNFIGIEPAAWLDCLITCVWFLAITNAFNLIDGMDGLAAGLAFIASLGMAGALSLRHLPGDSLILLGLAGACLGFLRYNFHPASIFMGDCGSMFLGFTLAAVALSTGTKSAALASIGVPLFAVGIPVFDAMLAIWRRAMRKLLPASLRQGLNATVMQADAEHLHHRLLRTGLKQHQVAVVLYGLNAVLIGIGLWSVLSQARSIGIFLVGFVVGTYVVVRHLARLELWSTGLVILEGLRRPPKTALGALAYPVFDVLALCLALTATMALYQDRPELFFSRRGFVLLFPVWVSIPFVVLAMAGTYSRVWSRARFYDFLQLGVAVGGGGLLAGAGTFLVASKLSGMQILRLTVSQVAFAMPLILASRAFFRAIQDLMVMFDKRHLEHEDCKNVLVYGAGYRGVLFLRSLARLNREDWKERNVVGLLDDDPNLHRRSIYGYRVLGRLDDLARIAEEKGIQHVIVTSGLSPERRELLQTVAADKDLSLSEWIIREQPLADEQPDGNESA